MITPADYAQKRLEAVELIRKHAPTRLQDALIELLRPAIALSATRADDSEIPLGASKFGGAPDVPAGFEWPLWNAKPLGFLAQINLEEVAPFDVEEVLPKCGVLSFFSLLSEEDFTDYGTPQQAHTWQVFYFENSNLSRALVPEGSRGIYPIAPAIMNVGIKLTVPNHPYWLAGLQLTDLTLQERDEWKNWQNATKFLHPYGKQHQMLGHPTELQDDPRYQTAKIMKSDYWKQKQWLLLFQFDEDEDNLDWMFGDSGAFFFVIHENDLSARDFAKTWFVADCL